LLVIFHPHLFFSHTLNIRKQELCRGDCRFF